MIKLNGNTITITEGDTLDLQVHIHTADGENYLPMEGDMVRFALKKSYADKAPLLEKEIPMDSMKLLITAEEMRCLKARVKPYVYDIQLVTAEGRVDTFIDRQNLFVTEEVG